MTGFGRERNVPATPEGKHVERMMRRNVAYGIKPVRIVRGSRRKAFWLPSVFLAGAALFAAADQGG